MLVLTTCGYQILKEGNGLAANPFSSHYNRILNGNYINGKRFDEDEYGEEDEDDERMLEESEEELKREIRLSMKKLITCLGMFYFLLLIVFSDKQLQ